jgi:hypothetical protein
MRARFINESLSDILRPKSEEEIWSLLRKLSPNEMLLRSSAGNFLRGVKGALERDENIDIDGAFIEASQRGHHDIAKFLEDSGALKNVVAVSGDVFCNRYRLEDGRIINIAPDRSITLVDEPAEDNILRSKVRLTPEEAESAVEIASDDIFSSKYRLEDGRIVNVSPDGSITLVNEGIEG